MAKAPRATLAAQRAYPIPEGASLAVRYVVFTTDGFMRGDVILLDSQGTEKAVIARNVPVQGSARKVRVMGDYARLFPETIPVLQNHQGPEAG